MKELDRNWLEGYKRIPRETNYIKNLFNSGSPQVPMNQQMEAPNYANFLNEHFNQRRQEGITQGQQQVGQEEQAFFNQHVQPNIGTLPAQVSRTYNTPAKLYNYFNSFGSRIDAARAARPVPREQYMLPQFTGQAAPTAVQPSDASRVGAIFKRWNK